MASFAAIPVKFAPKRKMIDFSLPKWRNKLGEFDSPDVLSWVKNLYQDKRVPTRAEYNQAYDENALDWQNRPMVLTKEDIDLLQEEHEGGAFEDTVTPGLMTKTLEKMRKALASEKVVFVY